MIFLHYILALILTCATHAVLIHDFAVGASVYYEGASKARELPCIQFQEMSDEQYQQFLQLRERNRDHYPNPMLAQGRDERNQVLHELLTEVRIPTTIENMVDTMGNKPAFFDWRRIFYKTFLRSLTMWDARSIWYHEDKKIIVSVFPQGDDDGDEDDEATPQEMKKTKSTALIFSVEEKEGRLVLDDFMLIEGELPAAWQAQARPR